MSMEVSVEGARKRKLEEPEASPNKMVRVCVVCLRKCKNDGVDDPFHGCEKAHLICGACTRIPGYGELEHGSILKSEYCPACNPMIMRLKRRERSESLVYEIEAKKTHLERIIKKREADLTEAAIIMKEINILLEDE